jgi:hypothetical protein
MEVLFPRTRLAAKGPTWEDDPPRSLGGEMPKITTQEIEVVKVPEEKPLSIRLLGPPEVSFEGRSLHFGRRKVLGPLLQRPPSRL